MNYLSANQQNTVRNALELRFSYDAFGNIKKTVPPGGTGYSFQPTYAFPTTNRIASLPGAAISYDSDGNLRSDADYEYTWNVESRLAQIDSFDGTTYLTYDAFGRMAEQASATNTEILYSPTGDKVALMNGQSLRNAFIPLPGGGQAVYASTGILSYYRHPDWLGSSRLATTSTRTVYYDGAYAPFGENYNETGTYDRFFTGQTQGTEYGIYDFLFRQQNPVQGRWLVPDPAGLAAVDLTNPQTWNRYAYVANNPLNAVDPQGLMMDEVPGCWPGFSSCGDGGGIGPEGPSWWPCCGGIIYPDPPWDRGTPPPSGGGGGSNPYTNPNPTGNGNDNDPYIFQTWVYWPFLPSTPLLCHLPNVLCFKYYGNWGGPGWTGGQFKPYETLSAQEKSYLLPPIDVQDACDMEHDICIANARVHGTAKGSCDFALQQCLRLVNESGAGNAHSWLAEPLFSICEMIHIPCHLSN